MSYNIIVSQEYDERLRRRFFVKFVKRENGCWEWIAARSASEYGCIGVAGKNTSAHRLSYQLHVGPIPDGLELDHLCRNRPCVNPAHLEPVTRRTNVLRGMGPTARFAAQDICLLGHSLDDAYRYGKHKRQRRCRTCAWWSSKINGLNYSLSKARERGDYQAAKLIVWRQDVLRREWRSGAPMQAPQRHWKKLAKENHETITSVRTEL